MMTLHWSLLKENLPWQPDRQPCQGPLLATIVNDYTTQPPKVVENANVSTTHA